MIVREMEEKYHRPFRGYLCVVTAAICWASSGAVGKYLFSHGITPFALVQVRVTVSSLLLAGFLLLRRPDALKIRPVDTPFFLLLGGVAMALVQITYFYAISKIQVAAAILIQYLAPMMIAFFSMLCWKERPTGAKLTALALSLAGCYLVSGAYDIRLLEMNRVGVLAGLASAFCFAVYTLLGERAMHRYGPWTVLFYALLFAALSWHVFYTPFQYLTSSYDTLQWTGMIYVSVIGTLVPFGLFFVGVNHIRSTRASITATLEPISAGMIAYLFLGERLEALQVAGGAAVIFSVILLQASREGDELVPARIRASAIRDWKSRHPSRQEPGEEAPLNGP
ncbi:MAG: EamA family transporter [Deltaproteobacteria bacterium]|nr:EamA family transporter [Deltaproteobacteria bacterium]MBW1950381.1 EamA family transporter [Deltaproteobacteria bacterium]MBW2008342.1 EamA family transporter [Deltaproteobacteria bacterium]